MRNYHLKTILDAEIKEVNSIKKIENINLDNLKNFLYLTCNKDFYNNIQYEISTTKKFYNNKKYMIMVGCGYLPLSLISYCNFYPNEKFIGLDINKKAILCSNNLKTMLNIKNVLFECENGLKYNYKKADTILIAAMVKNKIKMLNRIIDTCKSGTNVFIRLFYKVDYNIIEKLDNEKIKIIFKIDKNTYPKKEDYDLIVLKIT